MPPESQANTPPSDSNFWTKLKLHIIHPELTPQQVAWSFGIGLSIAWNPILGLHTLMVIVLCIVFRRLHRPLMLIAAFINNPWTMVPIATASTYLGSLLLGRGLHLNLRHIDWHSIGLSSFTTMEGFWNMMIMLRPILAPYILGGLVFSVMALPAGYFFMLYLTRKLRKAHFHLPHIQLHKNH
jgi:uncharacterized protein (DUF2062 family)